MELLTIALRFGLYLDLMVLFGLPFFSLYGPRRTERSTEAVRALRGFYAVAAIAGLLFSAVAIVELAATMSGVPLDQTDSSSISMLVFETSVGWAWQARMVALVLFLALPILMNPASRLCAAALTGVGGIALGSLAWAGHGAADEGSAGAIHLGADIIHLLAAGIWLGALFALANLLLRRRQALTPEHIDMSHRALASFSLVGTAVVAILVLTGLLNTWFLIGIAALGSAVHSTYGELLLAKLLLFLIMLGLAAMNRYRMTPALERAIARSDHRAAVAGLRLTLALETASAVAILALVAWLGTLAPPISEM